MKKRGAGHIEVIISYILFIGFLLFIFYFFNPVKSSKILDSSLPVLMEDIKNNLSSELKTYSIKILADAKGEDTVAVDFDESLSGKGVRVENYSDGSVLPYSVQDKKVIFKPRGEKFVLIKISEAFSSEGGISSAEGFSSMELLGSEGAMHSSTSDTEISYVGKRMVFFQKLAEALSNRYSTDYEGLKTGLNLRRTDFTFELAFQSSDGRKNINGTRFIPAGLEVYSDSIRDEMMRDNGQAAFGDLIVRIW